ncbi:hypothetical protein ACWGI9_00160 [Streptomyces sp. NPDC054833]
MFGPFSRILKKFPDIPVRSYFSGLALARHFPDIHLTGTDNSGAAVKPFPARHAGLTRFVKGNLLDSRIWPKSAVDVVLLGNTTPNSFTSAPDTRKVVRNLRGSRTGGAAGGRSGAASTSPRSPGSCATTASSRRVRGMRLRSPVFRGIHEERLWTSREVRAMAEKPGLAYEGRNTVEVTGGGALGWPVDALVYCAQA